MRRPTKALVVPIVAVVLVVTGGLVFFGPFRLFDVSKLNHADPPPSPARSGAPGALQVGWVKEENAKRGTRTWHLSKASRHGAIEGYANAVSINRGEPVSLFVSTQAAKYTVEAFRMGYYGGAGARLIWTSPEQAGSVQHAPSVARATNMVETSWTPSLTVQVDPSWPPGDYLFKLIADSGVESYVPLTVRDDASTSALLINNSVTTWQAYNLWGGASLYSGRTGRAQVVSFDRPYEWGDGSGDFLGEEFPMVSLVESLGLDISYTTNLDLHLHPESILAHRALISLGHDEYWSTQQRRGVEAARDHGVNLAFFGANAVYRHIRLDPSPLGPARHEVNYRSAATDPMTGVNNAEVTVSWREPPVSRPENTLLGELYQCNPVRNDFVVAEPEAWVYAGSGFHAGSKIIALIGSEYDAFVPGMPGPPNVEIFAHSPVRCRGTPGYADFTYYAAFSGAGVIDVGTNQWVPLLTNPDSQPGLVRITENILDAFGAGPAGAVHPSTPNYKTLPHGRFPPPSANLPREEVPTTTSDSSTRTTGRPAHGSTSTTSRDGSSTTILGHPPTTTGSPPTSSPTSTSDPTTTGP